ncbi:MAG: DUF4417 domain-containing protein [Erysipelotrichaceae bacterium]|jgi:hypothetical protein|nr:DUF4417 domain-containing protein [Erysipelotrichaceae bacterium]
MKKSSLKKPSNIKDVFGAFLLKNAEFSKGQYDMPMVRSSISTLPTSLFPYQRIGKKKPELQGKTALHFYNHDYIFDGKYGVWNALMRGVEFERGFNLRKLDEFYCIIAPDYSLYLDMPLAWQIWNVYRNRVVTHALQELGYRMVVNVRWTNEASYEFCFSGIEEGSIVAVGSYGCSKTIADRCLFDSGLEELIIRVIPETIIIYGSVTDSMKSILLKYNQKYIAFRSDTSVAMEVCYRGNESK